MQRGNFIALLSLGLLVTFGTEAASPSDLKNWFQETIPKGFILQEEIHLSEEMLDDLTAGNPRLAGLKSLDAYVYRGDPEQVDLKAARSLTSLRERFESSGWRLVWYHTVPEKTSTQPERNFFQAPQSNLETLRQQLREELEKQPRNQARIEALTERIDKGKRDLELAARRRARSLASMVLAREREDQYDALLIFNLSAWEFVAVQLEGRVSLSALGELRSTLHLDWEERLPTPPLTQYLGKPGPPPQPSPSTQPSFPNAAWPGDLEELKRRIAEGKAEPDTALRLGMHYEALQRYEEALQGYAEVLEKFPFAADWVLAHAILGQARSLEQLQRFEDAKQMYKKLLREFPEDDYYGVAARLAIRRLAQFPDKWDAKAARLFNYADVLLYNQGQTGSAIDSYEAVVRVFPGSRYAPSAQAMAAYCRRWSGGQDEDAWRELFERYPSDLALYELGRSLIQHEKFSEAIEYLQKLLREYPRSELTPHAAFLLARTYDMNGQAEQAIKAYSHFLQTFAPRGASFVPEARISLERLKRGAEKLPFLGIALRRRGNQVFVNRVIPGSAAERAGLRRGDVIVAVENIPVNSNPKEVTAAVIAREIGETITLRVLRNGKEREVQATLGRRE